MHRRRQSLTVTKNPRYLYQVRVTWAVVSLLSNQVPSLTPSQSQARSQRAKGFFSSLRLVVTGFPWLVVGTWTL